MATDSQARAAADGELIRYVKRADQWNLRERRQPDFGFQTGEATPLDIGLVGFVPKV